METFCLGRVLVRVLMVVGILALTGTFEPPCRGQVAANAPGAQPATGAHQYDSYIVGPGDLLSVTVQDMPDLNGKYRVSSSGYIMLPGLPNPIKAEGLTPLEIARSLASVLKSEQILVSPVVGVQLEENKSRTVTVLGAVAKPSLYPIDKPNMTALEAISEAGGLLPTAGGTLTILHATPAGEGSDSSKKIWQENIDLGKLMAGADPSLNVTVHPGDVMTVATAPVVYVVGAVTKPGAFVFQDPKSQSTTVLEALALAEGLNGTASAKNSWIVRRDPDKKIKQEIPIDIAKLMQHRIPDQALLPDDILFIPDSRVKKTIKRVGDVAAAAATGVAYYGLGTRVAK